MAYLYMTLVLPHGSIKKTQQRASQSVLSCQTGKKWVEQDSILKNRKKSRKN